jgi:hypothetical protein
METEERQGRAEEVRRERRRRGNDELAASQRLPIPPEVQARLDQQGLVPRWVNDEGNRMHRFTVLDDYDPVEGVAPVPVGTAEDGKPIMAHLLAKRRDFIEEDQRARDKRRRETEEAMVRNPDEASRHGVNPNPASAQTYVVKGSSINRGNQILE